MSGEALEKSWKTNPRWKGIVRPYSGAEVEQLAGTMQIDHSLARIGAERLWKLLSEEHFIRAMGAMTGCQAVQQVQAGLKAIYVSGWQVAADANDALETYPDLSLYPVTSVPQLIRRINKAFIRADQIQHMDKSGNIDWHVPIVADAEAGFGGPLNTFELVRAMIEAGTAGIHLEDQLSSLKKCGHMGGKVLVPSADFIEKLITARFTSDVLGVPTVLIGRTDAHSANMIRSDADEIDQQFMTGERSSDGYFYIKGGIPFAVARGLAYAPYCDLVWCETSTPDLGEAKEFAEEMHRHFPGKLLAYNCSPSFNWKKHLDNKTVVGFQEKLATMGYKFQFITLAGFHTLNASMFDLAHHYNKEGMAAYAQFQEKEFALEKDYGFKAIKHQRFVGTAYFDQLMTVVSQGKASTHALKGSTEEQQFHG
jgi:isocitrate lyase